MYDNLREHLMRKHIEVQVIGAASVHRELNRTFPLSDLSLSCTKQFKALIST
jgi:hypothetical protein